MQKLTREFYNRDTRKVALELLGSYLVHNYQGQEQIGRIVEVEAYLGAHDLASHSARGKTERTKAMFGPPGYAYIYMIYGLYHCMNVVTEPEGHASAILIRAIEPIKNIQGKTKGPGLLCKAMHIDKQLNQQDLLSDQLYIAKPNLKPKFSIIKRPRIGVEYAGHWTKQLLRFYIKDNEFISKK